MHYLIEQIQSGEHLSCAQSRVLFEALLGGALPEADIATMLLALKSNGETIDEITGAAQAMRALMIPLSAPDDAMDVCGTGGDGKHTYNISTTVALVLASCGVPVVKHGNRAVSSSSGSSDVLSALGVGFSGEDTTLQRCLDLANICYAAAPLFHPSLRHVAPVRAKLKTRTIFNVLGPLCNPAQVTMQLMGVYDEALCTTLAQVLHQLGSTAAAVVHGREGLDELSVSFDSRVAQLLNGDILAYDMTPEKAGLPRYAQAQLKGGDAAHNARALLALLNGAKSAYRDAVLLNTAAALVVADKADDAQSGVALAAEAIDSGRASHTLAALIQASSD